MSDEYLEPLSVQAKQSGRVNHSLRPVAISGHQEYWRGWFHGFGDSVAFVEDALGRVYQVEIHQLQFVKPIGEVPNA